MHPDWNSMSEAMRNRVAREMLDRVLTPSPLVLLYRRLHPSPPLTRWQRARRRLEGYLERIALAWRVLRGDDIHDGCDR